MDSFYIKNNKAVYNCIKYDFDKLPENVVFDGDIVIGMRELSKLPNMSSWIIKGHFDCSFNDLLSLKGCPIEVGDSFDCAYNKLTSLKGCPIKVGGGFYCHSNKIKIIDSWSKNICSRINITRNPIESIKEGAMPLEYIIEFYKKGWYNAKELLMKEFGADSEEEINAYLLMMGKM